ncbi:MAG: DUF480 domain-containing protein [Acidimicrobiales bacterium]
MHLSLEQGRLIGCLIEKQLTTSQQYPLTLNALVTACNQSSNRDPVVAYDEHLVEQVVTSLKDAGLVHFVYPSHGRSATRYRHALDERRGLDERALALVAVLLLRGPQTTGELRARTERMATFDGIGAVEAELGAMARLAEPLVQQLQRRPGQKEERWAQLLAPIDATAGLIVGDTEGQASGRREPSPSVSGGALPPPMSDAKEPGQSIGRSPAEASVEWRLGALAREVAAMRVEVAALRDAIELLNAKLSL